LIALLAACTSNKPAPKGAYGELCAGAEDCAAGLFCASVSDSKFCTVTCATNGDCPVGPNGAYLECGVLADGSKACLPGCFMRSPLTGFACIDGVPTSCEVLGDEQCEQCGCAAGMTCLTGKGCVPKSDVGGPCDADDDCVSNNCSAFAGVCRVPLGTPCSTSDCDYCLSGWYCSRECNLLHCEGGYCLGEVDGVGQPTGVYYCLPACDPNVPGACPGTQCRSNTEAQISYCECGSYTSCPGMQAPRAVGQPCRSDDQCSAPAFCLGSGGDVGGYCSVGCTTSAECGAGLACIATAPCSPGATCAGQCRPACTAAAPCAFGVCDQRTGTDGASTNVCVI